MCHVSFDRVRTHLLESISHYLLIPHKILTIHAILKQKSKKLLIFVYLLKNVSVLKLIKLYLVQITSKPPVQLCHYLFHVLKALLALLNR